MAIKSFKDIIDSKGYRINNDDRAIFELGNIQSFFGFSKTDCIEFILYDANDNQLPQQNYGLVRYLPLTSENIRDYFLVAEGTIFQKYQFPSEYFIDAERLINEAGYNNGIFKIQITLLNKRVGSEGAFDKLWISEISPSRTEIRLFPHEEGSKLNSELKLRYGIFINDGSFREDVVRYAISFVEKISPNYIASFLKTNFGEAWFNLLLTEYQIKGFDSFATTMYNKFVEATIFEFTNRISDVNDLNYGKKKITPESIQLSKEYVKEKCEKILIQVINKFLLNPVVKFGSKTTDTFESYDAPERILQTKELDLDIMTNPPLVKEATVIKTKLGSILENTIKEEIKIKELLPPTQVILPDVAINLPLTNPSILETEKSFEVTDPTGMFRKLRMKKGEKVKVGEKLFKRKKPSDGESTPADSLTKKLFGNRDGSVNTPSRARGIFGVKGRGVVLGNVDTGNVSDAASMVTTNIQNNLSEL